MNYEEKYKEALKVIESLYNVVRYQSSTDALFASQTIEKAFPELAESEDEKIRKEIISIVKSYRESCITEGNHRFDDCISWLEKQGEKTIPKNIDDAALQYVDACAVDGKVTHGNITEPYWNNHSMMAAYKAGWLEKQGEQKLAESISQLTIQGKGVYKICPYCKERMVRDDSKVYTSMPPQYEYNCPKCGTMEFDTVMYDNPEMEEQKPAVVPKFRIGDTIRHKSGDDISYTIVDIVNDYYICDNNHSWSITTKQELVEAEVQLCFQMMRLCN